MGYIIHTCLNMPLVVRGRHLRLLECCHAGDSVDSPIFSAAGLAGSPRHWRTKWWEILRQKLVGEAEEKLKKEQKHHVFSCFFRGHTSGIFWGFDPERGKSSNETLRIKQQMLGFNLEQSGFSNGNLGSN